MAMETMKPFIKRKTATSSGDRRRLSYHHIVFFTLILFNILSCAFTQTFGKCVLMTLIQVIVEIFKRH